MGLLNLAMGGALGATGGNMGGALGMLPMGGALSLLNKSSNPGKPMNPNMPQMPQMGGGLMGAFSGNPGFQDQLGAIMAGQGPGMQAPQFTPPPVQVGMGVPQQSGGLGGLGRGALPMQPMLFPRQR